MKKVFLLLFLLLCAAPRALAGESLMIDKSHVYTGMSRAYRQGYAPTITGNTARVIVPLLSGECVGGIEAELIPLDLETTPIKLSSALRQTVEPKEYQWSGEAACAYLIDFKLALNAARLNGEYPFTISVRGQTANGEAVQKRFDFVLRVTDGLANDAPPDLIIEDFQADTLIAGSEGETRMRITNTGTSREARNISLHVSDPAGEILASSCDTLRIGDLLPGESADVNVPLRALSHAAIQPHAIELTIEYAYADDQSATLAERYTIDVDQEVRMEHTEAALPMRVTQGDNIAFEWTLMNMGKGVLNNALLTFDIPHLAGGGSVLAGNIDPGKSQTINANFRVDAEFTGETSGTLRLTWEDGYGKVFEKTLPLSTTVLEKATAPASAAILGNADEKSAKPSAREIAAWSVAGALLAVLIISNLLSSRRIRELEEKQL